MHLVVDQCTFISSNCHVITIKPFTHCHKSLLFWQELWEQGYSSNTLSCFVAAFCRIPSKPCLNRRQYTISFPSILNFHKSSVYLEWNEQYDDSRVLNSEKEFTLPVLSEIQAFFVPKYIQWISIVSLLNWKVFVHLLDNWALLVICVRMNVKRRRWNEERKKRKYTMSGSSLPSVATR